jgi:hypothetical protein
MSIKSILNMISIGMFFVFLSCIVCAADLQTNINEQLIIRATCTGENPVAEIAIYDSSNNLYVPRQDMTQLSATDFVFSISFFYEDTFTAYQYCTYSGGFHSESTSTILVGSGESNIIESSTYAGYDYQALLEYDVYFKSDPTQVDTILLNIGNNSIIFQPKELSLIGAQEIKNKKCAKKIVEKEQKCDFAIQEKEQKCIDAIIVKQIKCDTMSGIRKEKCLANLQDKQEKCNEAVQRKEDRCNEAINARKTKCGITDTILQDPLYNSSYASGNVFTYTNIYGPGLDLEYKVNNDYLKEEMVIASIDDLPQLDNEGIIMSLSSLMELAAGYNIIVDGVAWDKQSSISTANKVLIEDASNNIIYQLDIPVAFDSDGEKLIGSYVLSSTDDGIKVSVMMQYSWFLDSSRVYPIYLDPTVVWDGTSDLKGSIPYINIENPITIPVGQPYQINEVIMWGNDTIIDAECETDIIQDSTSIKVVDFRSFYDNQGIYQYIWDYPEETGTYTVAQYCWHGETLDLNKIYSNSTIIVE